ncbi:unnamed protein product [Nezara viridula]|uniref:Uncharacterized protein n=1 Tax=Nezara viridula TaxID=85310 RepID=A0A9P0HUT7_NEZVI|nr:unnamed protein product [Nezara viridula]
MNRCRFVTPELLKTERSEINTPPTYPYYLTLRLAPPSALSLTVGELLFRLKARAWRHGGETGTGELPVYCW